MRLSAKDPATKNNAAIMEKVKEDIRNKKIFDFIIGKSKITENKIKLD